jgi:hypothetical protein
MGISNWKIPKNIKLADPEFNRPAKVDILLGAELFYELLCVGQIKLGSELPIMQKTLLGWIVAGKCTGQVPRHQFSGCLMAQTNCSLDSLVNRFWELDQSPFESKAVRQTAEQQACELFFEKTVKQLSSGRFQVDLPFKTDPKVLGLSFQTAERRFLQLERKISKDAVLKTMYHDFMKEYLDLGHMSILKSTPLEQHYYIPHQCVLRPESSSTKLRVVFDASSKTSTAVSLNETLMVGPTIQRELYSILINFRLNKYAVTADISKMYRQINVSEKDRNFQLILWRENTSQNIQAYRLNTVTYGTASAPFLAIRCLFELANMHAQLHPIGSDVIKKCFYVDDMLAGADSIQELYTICNEAQKILESGCFPLAKWATNCRDLSFKTKASE